MKEINRRQFISKLSLTAAAATLYPSMGFASTVPQSNQDQAEEYVVTEIAHGKLRGTRTNGVNIFKGIPYGENVAGQRRFLRPDPVTPWPGVRDALALGAPAMQNSRGVPAPDENCLFLNVWTPANDNKKRPVMFYNHGGGFVSGSAGARGQDGANLARNFDAVVVATNHRLGLFGFLYLDQIAGEDYTGSGNMGVVDIMEGLKWVQANISQFGGDPNNVMIFGESGGGAKTSAVYAMPEASPFFNKASIESGPGVRMTSMETAAETTSMVLRELGLAPKDWRKLLELPATALFEVQAKFTFVPPFIEKNGAKIFGFGPVVDGTVLPYHPFEPTAPAVSKNKPLMTGWNEDEYTFFARERGDVDSFKVGFDGLKGLLEPQFGGDTEKIIEAYRESRPTASAPDIYVAVNSIVMMGLGSIEIAEKKAKENGAPVYLYNFGHKTGNTIPGTDYPMGTPHAMDISYKFFNVAPPIEGTAAREGMPASRPESFAASRNMAELWTSFAKDGVPSGENLPQWPAYNLEKRATMRIDTNCEVIFDRLKIELDMWRSIGRL